ncbi:MAG: type II secretion system inner membrane protein GspF [Comamonadaceae bacterium]|nr:type II secretion system inner membrane protein GspF [Comamonadaceae bacterium]
MPAYSFEALQNDGALRKGVVEADSAKAARTQLRAQSLVPLSVQALAPGSSDKRSIWQYNIGSSRSFSANSLAVWTRQLASLVGSGLPLERALAALSDEAESEKQAHLVANLRAEVNAGLGLAKAMSQHPSEFSALYTSVISAGEQGGNLGAVLGQLADDLQDQQTLKAKLLSASLYPAIVSLIALLIVIFLLSTVVPQVAQVFSGNQRKLPTLTVFMLALSDFVRNHGWTVALLLVLGWLGFHQAMKQPSLRVQFDAAFLKLPILGRLATGYNTARFASTLAMLTGAGVPILKALQSAADTLSNQAMREDVLDALVLVREGAPLAMAIGQKKRFPSLLAMFARLGEQTGQLPLMLQRAAQQLSADVQRRALALATILEPLLIVAMGGVVMLIVLAVLMPIMELNQWVR